MRGADQKLARLLEVADEDIGARLKMFEDEQKVGEKLNELTERFFAAHPRDFDAPWPSKEHREHDLKLRAFFERIRAIEKPSLKLITEAAKEALDIAL
jgi:hypothetical protein